MWKLLSGVYLGATLGANDAANIFGTAVFTNAINFNTAIGIAAIFITLGSFLEGAGGMETLGSLADQTNLTVAFISSLAAALTMTLMTFLKLPTSTSQAVVGGIIGTNILRGTVNFTPLRSIMLAWLLTPVGALIIAYLLYQVYIKVLERYINSISQLERYIKLGLVIAGAYGAYSLGANNVANVVGVYVDAGVVNPQLGGLIGGLSIALGTIYSKRVMKTVGSKITVLSPLTALIAVLAHSLTLYFYAQIGIPVSSSQAIVGGVIGIGLVKGGNMLDWQVTKNILFGWLGTPSIALVIGIGLERLIFQFV